MSESVKNAMYLRFFKNLSIGGVARELGISKGAAQTSIQRGCKYIKDFLDADIKFQNRKEREKFTKNKFKKNFKNGGVRKTLIKWGI